jgi:hypothetical protein
LTERKVGKGRVERREEWAAAGCACMHGSKHEGGYEDACLTIAAAWISKKRLNNDTVVFFY